MRYHSSNGQINIFKIPVWTVSYLTLCKYEKYSWFSNSHLPAHGGRKKDESMSCRQSRDPL